MGYESGGSARIHPVLEAVDDLEALSPVTLTIRCP